jgi:hypothetical protein
VVVRVIDRVVSQEIEPVHRLVTDAARSGGPAQEPAGQEIGMQLGRLATGDGSTA